MKEKGLQGRQKLTNLLRHVLTLHRMRSFLVYLLIFLLFSFLANIWMTRNQATGLMPFVISQDINGHSFRLEATQPDSSSAPSSQVSLTKNFPQEKPGLLYFFAEWCPICKAQHSVISSISQDYPVVGIAMQSGDTEKVKKYVAAQNIDFRVINDQIGKISQSFGVNGVPAVFVINQQGIIQFSTRGYVTGLGLRSRLWLADKSLPDYH